MDNSPNPTPVAVAGMGAVTALGGGVALLADGLRANASGLRRCARHAGRGYQSVMGGWVPEELLARLQAEDPEHADARAFLMARAALVEAQQNAGRPESVPPSRRALVLSSTKADVEALERVVAGQRCSPAARRHIHPALLAADLARVVDARGAVHCVSAACISGLAAIGQGAAMLRRGQADLVFVVGVDLASHLVLAGFSSLKALDPDGCRPFDRARIGLSLGEGAGALVLVNPTAAGGGPLTAPASVLGPGAAGHSAPAGRARAALIRAVSTSNDANHLTGPSRDGSGLALAMHRALRLAQAAPESIDYVHAHGTGTPFNDAMESHALRLVFGDRVPPFSSSKGQLGHTLATAGIVEVILCCLALRLQLFPGTPRLDEPDPVAPGSLLARPKAGQLTRILKVNCGFGGTNSALVLEQPPAACAAQIAPWRDESRDRAIAGRKERAGP